MKIVNIKHRLIAGTSALLFCLTLGFASAPVSATAYACGAQCNGKSANWVIPSNGIVCSKSARLVGSGHPSIQGGGTDLHVLVKTYYSTVCQTLWGVVYSDFDYNFNFVESSYRFISPAYKWLGTRNPILNHSVQTAMVDDHSPTNGKAADIIVHYDRWWGGGVQSHQTYLFQY